MSDAPEQSEEDLDAEIDEMLGPLKPGSVSTPTSFCVEQVSEDGN